MNAEQYTLSIAADLEAAGWQVEVTREERCRAEFLFVYGTRGLSHVHVGSARGGMSDRWSFGSLKTWSSGSTLQPVRYKTRREVGSVMSVLTRDMAKGA